jgi:hypothetical protein
MAVYCFYANAVTLKQLKGLFILFVFYMLVLQYLGVFDAPALQSYNPLLCGTGS